MARVIKLKRKSDPKPKGKDARDIEENRYIIPPGEGGALDKNKPLKKDENGNYYTITDKEKLPAKRGGKFNLKQKGKSARY